ncbi:MAG: SanA/YdcF family protein [Candidatus Promineifilaceae bacterium]
MRTKRKGRLALLVLAAGMATFPWLWRRSLVHIYRPAIHTLAAAPAADVALVYGAAVYRNDRLSGVLRDRMDTAIALYHAGRVKRLLVSGDNSAAGYDEPGAMRAYAVRHGVAPDDVQPDDAGRRTYDSCYRARHIFGVESALLISQAFHLPRALFTCQRLGIDSQGVAADGGPYRAARWYELRETAASLVALWDVLSGQKPAVLGAPIRQAAGRA